MASIWRLICPEHSIELMMRKTIPFTRDGIVEKCPMFFCEKCSKYYIHTDAVAIHSKFDYGQYEVINTENKPYQQEQEQNTYFRLENFRYDQLFPEENRRTSAQIEDCLSRFEDCLKNYRRDFPYSLLHYAFLFRRFDAVNKIMLVLTAEEWEHALHLKGETGYRWITPLVCAKWNLNYLCAYDEKNNTHIYEAIENYLDEVESVDEVMEYTDVVDREEHSIFDIVFGQQQPLLDVVYYAKQELASKQVRNHRVTLVMDEVGTGKTVSALYAIRDIIRENKSQGKKTKVLVVCPYNKRDDWQSDIRRQLGRYAHIVEQGDPGAMYSGSLKKIFFKEKEEIIMIAGQKQGSDLQGVYTALKGSVEKYSDTESWDLIIIDEGHISFENYHGLEAERAMLLTATPIVVNARQKRTFQDYSELLCKITGAFAGGKQIEPIHTRMPSEKEIYVNWFREDMGKKAAERNIQFISCERHPDRDIVYDKIKEKMGTLAALTYDQDDNYLFEAAANQYGFTDIKQIRKNGKLEKLVELLQKNQKSYLIFCEHQYVVNLIFERLKDQFEDVVIAEKFGKFENQHGLGAVQDGQLIHTLMQALRAQRRILFVTTGKTGGTGLNLGEFDGVIHYELPFTSIELEQRFGRVDRIDTETVLKDREMIFMLNDCKADENDMEVNRMLYYCITKIDITCQYMPIRNTVLYYPEFIKRNGRAICESLLYFQNEYVLSEKNEQNIKELRRRRKMYENQIKRNQNWQFIEDKGKTVRECVWRTLHTEKIDQISQDYYQYMDEYLQFLKATKPERNEYQRVYRQFLEAKRNVKQWLAVIGFAEISENSDLFAGYNISKEGQEEASAVQADSRESKNAGKISSIQSELKELIDLVEQSDFEHVDLKDFSSEGIFCYIDHHIRRLCVKDYRDGAEWK